MEKFFEDDLIQDVWTSKYRHEDETLTEFFQRLVSEFVRLDNFKNADLLSQEQRANLSAYGLSRIGLDRVAEFTRLFTDFKYIVPGGSVLSGVRSKKPVSLSNCYVIKADDSIGPIFDAAKDMAEIYKRRGGVGIDLSVLRPKGANVNNSAKTTSGVVPFMELYSTVTNTIGQSGRRGALMLSIDINHPDSPDFITAKQDLTKVTGANISVKLNDKFMQAVENDSDYLLCWPTTDDYDESLEQPLPYNELVTIQGIKHSEITAYIKKVRAKELWDSIIQCAWKTAEPGVLFWDNIINNDPASVYPQFKAVSTNPCGEIPLSPYDSCRLIATNLYNLVDCPFYENAELDYEKAYRVFYEAQIIGDILVDLEAEAVQRIIDITTGSEQELWIKIKEIGLLGRRTGVGLMGLGDMLAALGKDYTSYEIIDKLMSVKLSAELDATIDLAIINGPFPAYNNRLEYFPGLNREDNSPRVFGLNSWYEFIRNNFSSQFNRMQSHGRRNVSFSTIAPTGTISILAGVSSGCEPAFSLYYTRRKKCNPGEIADFIDQNGVGFKNYNVIHPKFKEWFNNTQIPDLTSLQKTLEELTSEELDQLIQTSPWFNNTAEDLQPFERVKVQSILQRYTTHSISSTVNMAKTATVDDVAAVYTEAFASGCKGITVYVNGSRSDILFKAEKPKISSLTRPTELDCKVMRFKNERKNWIAFVGIFNGSAYEIFSGVNDIDELPIPSYIETGKIIKIKTEEGSRYDFSYVDKYGYGNMVGGLNRIFDKEFWNYARFVSALLREQIPIQNIIKIIEKLEFTNKGMNNWKTGIIRSLKVFVPDGTMAEGATCENCGSRNIIYEGGCMICRDCGSSHCG
jgi:ribonucleoside-diphosphate reductase alpha chain